MSEEASRVILGLAVVAAFIVAMCLLVFAPDRPGYRVVDLNGTSCIVFDSKPDNGGETTELDRLRCPSGTAIP